jgi:hypothetical protein
MASDAEICNVALTFIERGRITSLDDGSTPGNDCNAIFVPVREDLLRGHDWSFARERVKLAQSATAPVSEFDYQYALPSDFLRVIVVADNDNAIPGIPYKREGTFLLCSAEDVYLTYIYNLTDPAKMDPDFRDLFSAELAMRLARTNTDREMAMKWRKRAWNKATGTESIEDYPPQRPLGSWVTKRFGLGRDIYRA